MNFDFEIWKVNLTHYPKSVHFDCHGHLSPPVAIDTLRDICLILVDRKQIYFDR